MKTIKAGGHKLEIYDSIDELPVKRFHKFNKYMLVDSNIGSDLNDITASVQRIEAFVVKNDAKNALQGLANLRESLFLIAQEKNIRHLSFMPLIKSIDGQPVTDISDENLERLLAMFKNEKVNWFIRLIESVKKKIEDELGVYFPGRFDDSAIKNYYERVLKRARLQLAQIVEGQDNSKSIQQIDDYLLMLVKPKIFHGSKNAEVLYDKQFEEMCVYLKDQSGFIVDDKTTVVEFYTAFEYVKEKNRPRK